MPQYEEGEFSVVQFFEDESYEYVRRWVSAEEAMKAVKHYINSVGARIGTTKRVLITDGGDMTNFHWEYGKGIVFPTKEQTDAIKAEGNNNGPTN